MPETEDIVARVARRVRQAKRVLALTGAGISTESGLADFRSPGGLWERFRIVTYSEFLESHDARVEYWSMRRELIPTLLSARPNSAHLGLAELEALGKLTAVVTQNIDGLHQAAGSRNVIELHGTNRTAACLGCGKQWSIEAIQMQLEGGNLDPQCDVCAGLIKPATVSFGQSMPAEALNAAFELAEQCDLLLMIGSSLEVQPAATLPMSAYQAGAKLIFVNRTATAYDELADVLVRDSAGQFMQRLLEACQSETVAGEQPISAWPRTLHR